MPVPDQTPSPPAQPNQPVWATINFFEQILQTMPEDRISLEVLSQAYEQAGDRAQAFRHLVRLAELVLRERDHGAAPALQERLHAYADQTEAAPLRGRLEQLIAATQPAAAPVPAAPAASARDEAVRLLADPAARRAAVSQELDFAWLLHEQKLLTEEQYAMLVSDLTDLSDGLTPAPISVLRLFQDRQLPNLDGALAFAAEKSGLPILPLAAFEPQAAAYSLLPRDYLVVKGALPFEVMSQDLLVGVLNPLNEALRREIGALTGRRCHFFLVPPADFDLALDKMRKQAAAAAKT